MSGKQILGEIVAYARYIALVGGALLGVYCVLRILPYPIPLPALKGNLLELSAIAYVATFIGRG